MAKKSKKTLRREYTKTDVKELRAHSKARTEPPRVCRRPLGLSYAAMAGCSSMA
ncbi:hypothetical protein ACVWZK_001479 [Bradyrhizobium sp. GM0.4]